MSAWQVLISHLPLAQGQSINLPDPVGRTHRGLEGA